MALLFTQLPGTFWACMLNPQSTCPFYSRMLIGIPDIMGWWAWKDSIYDAQFWLHRYLMFHGEMLRFHMGSEIFQELPCWMMLINLLLMTWACFITQGVYVVFLPLSIVSNQFHTDIPRYDMTTLQNLKKSTRYGRGWEVLLHLIYQNRSHISLGTRLVK